MHCKQHTAVQIHIDVVVHMWAHIEVGTNVPFRLMLTYSLHATVHRETKPTCPRAHIGYTYSNVYNQILIFKTQNITYHGTYEALLYTHCRY